MTPEQISPNLADGSIPRTPEQLFASLDQLGVPHTTVTHPPMKTVEESKTLRAPSLHGGYTKNLFLRAKTGHLMWLITCDEDRTLDLRSLADGLNAGRLSFGSKESLMKHLGVTPGAVSPLALINDISQAVCFVIEEQLLKHRIIHLHPLDNRRTTAIETQDLLRFTQITGHPALGLTFSGSKGVITRTLGDIPKLDVTEI